ncbi:MAG: translation elongation factor Ts, partial [Calditrichaceae bacterium]
VNCETDFVANTDDFKEFVKNISMHIAASSPLAIKREDLDQAVLEKEKEIFREQALNSGKPANIVDKIVDGRLEKYYAEVCLLEQPYVKDPDKKVQDLLTETIAKVGENVSIKRFSRFRIGE